MHIGGFGSRLRWSSDVKLQQVQFTQLHWHPAAVPAWSHSICLMGVRTVHWEYLPHLVVD